VLGGEDRVEVDVERRALGVQVVSAEAGARRRVAVDGRIASVWDHGDRRVVEWLGHSYRLRRPKPLTVEQTARDRGAIAGEGRLSAPMPARVVKVAVAEGDQVTQNQPLVVLEAMKMEHVVEAPHAGIVIEIRVKPGDQVPSGTRLLTIGSAAKPQTVE
jgi:biotin carboxyl carrier protein